MAVSYFKGSFFKTNTKQNKTKQNKTSLQVVLNGHLCNYIQTSIGKIIWLTAQQQWMPKVVLSDNLIDLFNFLFTEA